MNTAEISRTGLAESVERLESMPEFLRAALDAVPAGQLSMALAPGSFSLLEHACHLRDLEGEGYLVRIRRVLAQDAPALDPFDGAAVAATRDYLSQDAAAAAEAFAQARHESLRLLQPLTPGELAREAIFAGERVCLLDLVAMMVEHDREHRREIEALLDELEAH
jgi:hypothetical protein